MKTPSAPSLQFMIFLCFCVCSSLLLVFFAFEHHEYTLGSPVLTLAVSALAWLGICVLFEYTVAVVAPLSLSAHAIRRGVSFFFVFAVLLTLVFARFVWTSETYSGTPWMKDPQIAQLCAAGFVVAVTIRFVFLWKEKESAEDDVDDSIAIPVQGLRQWALHVLVCLVLAGAALSQALPNISGEAYNLQNDEYLQYGAAVGYNHTGQWVDWDFTKNDVQRDSAGAVVVYDRAHVSTWQMAMAMRIFGESEAVARGVAVAWFVLFLWAVYGVAFYWSRSIGVAAFMAIAPVFFDGVMMHARMVRMYSPLLTISMGLLVALWQSYAAGIAGTWGRLFVYSSISAGLLLLGWEHQELILIIVPGVIGFVFVEWLRFFIYKEKNAAKGEGEHAKAQQYRTVFLLLLSTAAIVAWFVNASLDSAIFTTGHIGIRKALNTQYEFLAFMDFALPLFVAGLYAASVVFAVFHRKSHPFERYVATVSLVVIVVMLVFVLRYKAYRYIQFLLPFVGMSVWLYWYRAVRSVLGVWIEDRQALRQWANRAAVAVFFVAFVPLSIAGVPVLQPWFTQAQADKVTETDPVLDHHVSVAYDFVRSQKTPGSFVVTMSFRDLYWKNDPSLQVITLPENDVYTIDQLNAFFAAYPTTEMWFVWEQGKEHHLKPAVLKAIQSRAVNLSSCDASLKNSNMKIYYYGQQKIDCSN